MRALCLYLPRWSTDLRRRAKPDDRRPMVTVVTTAERQVVVSCCAHAERAGVVPAMSLAHARALVPRDQLRIEPHDEPQDREAMGQLAGWSTTLLPKVMPDADGSGLMADITGCERLYRGERPLLRRLASALRRGGFAARVATAPTYGAAWAVAHFDDPPIKVVEDGDLRDALSPLPVDALRLDARTVDALAEVGLDTIGQLAALARASLPSRYGNEVLHRLDQAFGHAFESIEPIPEPTPPGVCRDFAGPVKNLEAIALAGRQLLGELCRRLLELESGATRFRLDLDRYEATDLTLWFSTSRPSRDERHLWQLLWPKLEHAHLGHGVETMVLTATATVRLRHQQIGPEVPEAQYDRALGELLDRLDARLGSGRMMRVTPHESHLPERAYRRHAGVEARVPPNTEVTASPRPSRLLYPPEPVQVMAVTPDGPVVNLTWHGESLPVTQSIGPERITDEWWRGRTGQRDYFRVCTQDGRWLWVFRSGRHDGRSPRGSWFVHGVWA
ncbi:MAG: DNA polymerase Y family protein [Planctomycetota bacterium]